VTPADNGPAPETQSSVVAYLPGWMTVGGPPHAMIARLPLSSKPVTILFTAVPFTQRYWNDLGTRRHPRGRGVLAVASSYLHKKLRRQANRESGGLGREEG
jgi:hypothetical protein